jgi:DNA-binding NarL/FixJ family response regulator
MAILAGAFVLRLKVSDFTTKLDPVAKRGDQLPRARILLADDHTAILDLVSGMLKEEYDVIGTVVEGNSVCSQVKRLKPDLIVLDISMGECSGIEIARRLQEQGYTGEIVFLTVHEDPDFVSAAIGAGGRGYVIKARVNVDLRPAVEAALLHRVFVSTIRD